MYMKRKVLINKFKKYKNLNFHKNGLGPLYNWGRGGGGVGGGGTWTYAFLQLEGKWT